MDEDERQEYECLLLEGHDPAEARKLARAANDRINSKRLSGPMSGDTRHGRGVRPLVTDFAAEATSGVYDSAVPLTLDSRSDWERESDWDRADFARKCLDLMTPRQKEAAELWAGFHGPLTGREMAARLGTRVEKAHRLTKAGGARVRRVTGVTNLQVVGAGPR
jgi:hypothetical protein